MDTYQSKGQLFNDLKPAFQVKLTLLEHTDYNYIRDIDIWNYLKVSKWSRSVGLGISDMTDDIINVDITSVDKFLKDRLYHEKKKIM